MGGMPVGGDKKKGAGFRPFDPQFGTEYSIGSHNNLPPSVRCAASASSRPLVVRVRGSREIWLYLILLEATAAGSMELALLR